MPSVTSGMDSGVTLPAAKSTRSPAALTARRSLPAEPGPTLQIPPRASARAAESKPGSPSAGSPVSSAGSPSAQGGELATEAEEPGAQAAAAPDAADGSDEAGAAEEAMGEAGAVAAESSGPGAEESVPALTGRAHVQSAGWTQVVRSASGTYTIGTTGQAKRLEALELRVAGGTVRYKAHVQREGWQPWRADGAMAGSTGQARRVEAVRLSLQGEVASGWELQYRVHVQSFGWTRWVRDGEPAGTTGLANPTPTRACP